MPKMIELVRRASRLPVTRKIHSTPVRKEVDQDVKQILTRLTDIAGQGGLQPQPIDPWTLFKSVGVPIMAIFAGGLSGGFYLVRDSIRRENELHAKHIDERIDGVEARIDGVESRIDQRIDDLRKDNQANFGRLFGLFQATQSPQEQPKSRSWFGL